MLSSYQFVIEDTESKQRIDKFLTVKLKDFTRSKIQLLCEKRQVKVNGNSVTKNYLLESKDVVDVEISSNNSSEILPETIDFRIFFQDDFLAIIEKPKGLLIYPTDSVTSGTLVNGLIDRFGEKLSNFAGDHRPGIVHRLDKDTSGLLIVAFDNMTHEKLNLQMLEHRVNRAYKGIVYGKPKENQGIIDQPIGRNPIKRTQMAVVSDGRAAKTEYQMIAGYSHFSQLEFKLYTGRTHQIRVHSAHMGNPLAGDSVYGPKKAITELKGQCLHAYKLGLEHPRTGKELSFETDLPDYFTKFIKKIDV